jgi:hypothetical protein
MLKREKFIPPSRDEVFTWKFLVPARRADEAFIWEFFISLRRDPGILLPRSRLGGISDGII